MPASEEIRGRMHSFRQRLYHAAHRRVMWLRTRCDGVASQRPFRRPFEMIHDRNRQLDELSMHSHASMRRMLREHAGQLATMAGKIETLSPLGVLGRGYSLTYAADDQRLITSAGKLRAGQRIVTRFQQGTATSVVEKISKDES